MGLFESNFFKKIFTKERKEAFKLPNTQTWLFTFAFLLMFFIIIYILIETGLLSRYYSTILLSVLIMIILASSLNISTGFLGQLVLGHAAFMAIGAYTAALIGIALEPFIVSKVLLFSISALGGMTLAGLAGLLVGTPALRLKGDYLGIMTLGFGEIVKNVLVNIKSVTNGAQGLTGIPRIMSFELAYAVTILVILFIVLFMASRHGRAILSIREDEIAAESVGINIVRYKLMAFVISSALAGIGGAVFAFKEGTIVPEQFNFIKSVEIFVIVVLGGMGSLSGTIIAAITIVFLPELLRDFQQFRLLAYSGSLILVMLFRPQGLMGTKEIDLDKLRQRVYKFFRGLFKKEKRLLKDGDDR
jgi:branched-chain amino acid transport system permease protein